ncbi:MAG: energy transducer TonB, partial [Draconibacterium sp.]
MKENNRTNNDLEQLFSAVTAQSPLLSEEQVRTLLVNHPVVRPNNWVKDFFLTHLNTLLIGVSIVLVILTATLLWVNSDDKNAQTITEYSLRENVVVPVITDTIDTLKVSHAAENISVEVDNKTITKKPEVKPVSTVATEDSVSVDDILKYHQKKLQVFTIPADRDTTLICEEGTSIEIKANSFVSENTGEEIAGNVRITVQEYYDQADIVLAGLSTTSGDKLLETGGMLHVEARAGKEKCVIKSGRDVQVGFPYSEKKEDMTLFYGKQTGTRIDWQLANNQEFEHLVIIDVAPALEQEKEVFLIVEEMPEFPEGSLALRSYIDQNAIIPFSVLKDCVQGKVDMQFLVSNTGAVKNIRILRSSNNLLDKAAVYLVSKMPKWKPGVQRGNPVNVLYSLSVS